MTTYGTVPELRQQIEKDTTGHDTILRFLLDKSSELIDRHCNRPDGFVALTTATDREYSGNGTGVLWIDECIAVTLVEAKDSPQDSAYTAWASTDWRAATGDPRRPNFNRTPYTFLLALPSGSYSLFPSGRFAHRPYWRTLESTAYDFGAPTVRVTAKWGYATAAPGPIILATIAQAARWYKRGQGTWSTVLASGDFGSLNFTERLDAEIEGMLKNGRFIIPTQARG